MLKVLAVIAFIVVAQIIPSCGEDSGERRVEVIGWVDEKRTRVNEELPYLVVINNHEYSVTYEFWLSVDVGDLVKREAGQWTIVRKARR